jgi:hypothetical protein
MHIRTAHHQDPVSDQALVAGEDIGRQVRPGQMAQVAGP